MMINPPIEKLADKVGNSYILANIVGKRAKQLEKDIPDIIEHSNEKAISIAAREVETGRIVVSGSGENE